MEKCFYCEIEEANDDRSWYRHQLFYVVKRTALPSGMQYKSEYVKIPRCRSCKKTHNRFLLLLLLIGLVLFGASSVICYYLLGTNLLTGIILSALISFFITAGIKLIYNDFFAKSSLKIRPEDAIADFPLVNQMIKEGWVLSKPDPALAQTADENKAFQKRMNEFDNKP